MWHLFWKVCSPFSCTCYDISRKVNPGGSEDKHRFGTWPGNSRTAGRRETLFVLLVHKVKEDFLYELVVRGARYDMSLSVQKTHFFWRRSELVLRLKVTLAAKVTAEGFSKLYAQQTQSIFLGKHTHTQNTHGMGRDIRECVLPYQIRWQWSKCSLHYPAEKGCHEY